MFHRNLTLSEGEIGSLEPEKPGNEEKVFSLLRAELVRELHRELLLVLEDVQLVGHVVCKSFSFLQSS